MKYSRRTQLLVLAAGALSSSGTITRLTFAGTAVPPIPTPPQFRKDDPVMYGTQLAQYAEAYDSGWVDQYSKGKMTLIDARGDSVRREVVQAILEGSSGDKSLVRFMTPADIRGVAALIHEKPGGTDDSWLYLPASRRVRRISGANRTSSFQGTEFTYEDLTGLDADRYAWKFLGDGTENGHPVHVLEARPTYADTGYQKLFVSLHRTHFRAEKIEFFDKAGRPLKTLYASRFEQLHGRFWRPKHQKMHNHQTGKQTLIETVDLRLNLALYPGPSGQGRQNLSEALFTRRALEGS